jgi:hypothetical protein
MKTPLLTESFTGKRKSAEAHNSDYLSEIVTGIRERAAKATLILRETPN